MMQFVLNQQAQFAADFARIDDTIANLSLKTDRLAEGLVGLTAVVGQVAGAQLRGEEQLRDTADRFRADLHQMKSELRQALIDNFERHLREDHGRRSD